MIVTVITMESEHYSWLAVAETEQKGRRAIANRFDQHLRDCGDDNRERSIAGIGGLDTLDFSVEFGQDVDKWADYLDEWYALRVQAIELGKATVW